MDNNTALLERLEKVIDSLSDNSIKMGQMLAVHDEKLDKQDRIDAVLFEKIEQVDEKLDRHATDIKKGCERDIKLVDNRLRTIEKKMENISGGKRRLADQLTTSATFDSLWHVLTSYDLSLIHI